MPIRVPLLTVFITPEDERRVADLMAQRFPDLPEITFDVADDDPALREQWRYEHPGDEPSRRRCRLVVADTTTTTASRCAERILDVISPHAHGEAARPAPFPATPDAIPWTAHVTLWAGPPDRR
ncbi:hypothetical protein [Gordonia aurantiaca]|uniref:hypothetical protein n=1 Tax=Gordonia sp. B21 TaxID=3151852 RepID=UPI0032676348